MNRTETVEREAYERPEVERHGNLKEITLTSHLSCQAMYIGPEKESACQDR